MNHVLIIEDEPLLCWAVEQYVSSQGYITFTAQTADEAKKVLKSQNVNLILTDLFLPDASGVAVVEEIRRLHPAISIVAMTASPPPEEDMMRVTASIHTVLWKPFEMERLGELLRTILPLEAP